MKQPILFAILTAILSIIVTLFIVSWLRPDTPQLAETDIVKKAAIQKEIERQENKEKWDEVILRDLHYVRDPRNGWCYQRVHYSHTMTFTRIECSSVANVLVN